MTQNKTLAFMLGLSLIGNAHGMDNAPQCNVFDYMKWLSYVDVGVGNRDFDFADAGSFTTYANSMYCNRAHCKGDNLAQASIVSNDKSQKGFPYAWWILSDKQPKAGETLKSLGFNKSNQQEHLMYQSFENGLKTKYSHDSAISVIPCKTQTDYDLWVETSAKGFEMDPLDVEKFLHRIKEETDFANVDLYIAFVDTTPASTGMFIRHGESNSALTVCVHWLSTIKEFRGKHLATALCTVALTAAQQDGCSDAVLLASPMAVPFFKNLGFEVIETVDVYTPPTEKKNVLDTTPTQPTPSATQNKKNWFGWWS